jgi:hypothetical protein
MTADTLNDGSLDILASIKDADCDPVVGIMGRVSDERGVFFPEIT